MFEDKPPKPTGRVFDADGHCIQHPKPATDAPVHRESLSPEARKAAKYRQAGIGVFMEGDGAALHSTVFRSGSSSTSAKTFLHRSRNLPRLWRGKGSVNPRSLMTDG
jgi:hypothetical protein